jgi:vacuolar-type H+-ATPase subunit E/Vma4
MQGTDEYQKKLNKETDEKIEAIKQKTAQNADRVAERLLEIVCRVDI